MPAYAAAGNTGSLPFQPAQTIDEVITRLKKIIEESIHDKSRIGYFASLYLKVTKRIKEGIVNNEFESGERMEKFDALFANRYLEAVAASKKAGSMSASWQVTFNASGKISPLVLQHLLLGMNAHINLDLGIAAAKITGDQDIKNIRKDFNSINTILGSLVFEVLNQLNKVSPLLSLFGLHAGNDSILIQFSITNARDGAWGFAEELQSKKGAAFEACIAARDETIKKLGASLLDSKGFFINLTKWFIWLFEWKRPAKITRLLDNAEKKYLTINTPDTNSTAL